MGARTKWVQIRIRGRLDYKAPRIDDDSGLSAAAFWLCLLTVPFSIEAGPSSIHQVFERRR
jgi:hypothetical protein